LLTMFVGAALANQPILELSRRVERTPPSDPAWTEIEREAELLATETMLEVSNGWGRVVASFVVTYWLLGFSEFVWWLHENTIKAAVLSVAPFVFSLAVLWPLAVTSSNCDRLMAALNSSRLSHLSDPNAHTKICAVETALRRLNLDQGLGFSIAGSVVDKRKLKQIFIAGASTSPPLFATVMALRPLSAKEFVCSLETQQALALQTVVSTFNSTCVYNVTISADGVVQW
jgi:hypothetical protein